MKFLLAVFILMLPVSFLLGYFAGLMEGHFWEEEEGAVGNLEVHWGEDYDR